MEQLQVFSKEWFTKHKPKILWLLNHSSYFRKDMGIQECDLPNGEKITDITPNSFSYGDRPFMKDGQLYIERTTDFRTHDKFAKRLYYGFYPIWNLAHKFDMSVANRWIPKANLGFDTLFYPLAGANSPCDGHAFQNYGAGSGETYSTLRNSAGNNANVTGIFILIRVVTDNTGVPGDWIAMYRAILNFDTSILPDDLTEEDLSPVTLVVNSIIKQDPESNSPSINVYGASPNSTDTIISSDFTSIGITGYATALTYADWTSSGANTFTFNSTGISNINLTGITSLGLRLDYDVNNIEPYSAWDTVTQNTGFAISSADTTGISKDPKLVVTYTLPAVATGNFFMFM